MFGQRRTRGDGEEDGEEDGEDGEDGVVSLYRVC